MNQNLDFFSAFLIGLAGAGHCIAMCGGITTMLTSNISTTSSLKWHFVVNYHLGRIASYATAGAIAGFTGSLAAQSIGMPVAWLRLVAAIFVILLGLYIGQWSFLLTHVENIGKHLWRKLQPLAKHVIPVKSNKQALFLGALWGWLPCGLIYSTLTWSIASANWLNGALIMVAFGLGTLPSLLALSSGLSFVTDFIKKQLFRKITSLLLISYGFYSLFIALQLIL